ncbi:lactate utilization protein [Terasakiella sp. A23]|uniref:LutC/YkgG family protein n=1 Tax=Terasakiella sp. FCG-A23 TaxID=3080561 RepID=UPI0029534041|nr:lactate utilization protein [Terasakiella sp. A23]MDV7339356.1 lactate utilization protein [Terasakiella sp. A23]
MSNAASKNDLSNLRDSALVKELTASDFNVLKEKQMDGATKIATYKAVTEAVNTQVHEVERDNWIDEMQAVLAEKGIGQLMYGANSDLGKKLESDWDESGISLVQYQTTTEESKDTLFSVDAAITSTLGAIAETGSLILWPTKEEPRLLSLTSPVHVAVVSADQFYTTFYEAIEVNNWAANMPTNALLISGPSKTADIEQELCYGVHGPKELIVFIVH